MVLEKISKTIGLREKSLVYFYKIFIYQTFLDHILIMGT